MIFAVRHRPVQGARGPYRVNLRHGVSRIRSGQRLRWIISMTPNEAPKLHLSEPPIISLSAVLGPRQDPRFGSSGYSLRPG